MAEAVSESTFHPCVDAFGLYLLHLPVNCFMSSINGSNGHLI